MYVKIKEYDGSWEAVDSDINAQPGCPTGEIYDGTGHPGEAAAKQIGGTHYNRHKIQPWNVIDEYGLDFYRGNAIKYLLRNKMDTYEDIEKAIHYLEKWLEVNKESKQ